jgi:AAHS family 4-hydroxybenzoate transporter-like MFS transporter
MSRVGAVLGAGIGTSLASLGVSLQQVFLLLLIPITIGALCMAIKAVTSQRAGITPAPDNTMNGARK